MQRNWQDLIRPKAIEAEVLRNTYGKFVAKPLERGYGATIGNSLRRILLSSINGAAIVAVRIPDVEHEFSTLQGVEEDVTDIVLNLKQVNLRYLGDRPVTIHLKGGPNSILRAGDIETAGDVEILNPDQLIATIGEDGKLEMEMIVRVGRGYCPSDQNRDEEELPLGMIAIDSIFAPVRRVAVAVSNTRVGQMTDYDRLTLEVWTNGAVRPDDAIAYAAKILKEQLTCFINFDETADDSVRTEIESTEKQTAINENLFKAVDSLELSVRAANCLENADIKYIGELVTRSETEMLKTKNFGRKSLNEIKDILGEMGLSLGMKVEGFDAAKFRQDMDKQQKH